MSATSDVGFPVPAAAVVSATSDVGFDVPAAVYTSPYVEPATAVMPTTPDYMLYLPYQLHPLLGTRESTPESPVSLYQCILIWYTPYICM